MSRLLTVVAMTLGIVAVTAGSAFAGCSGHGSQSVSIPTQTASTGDDAPSSPKPEDSSD